MKFDEVTDLVEEIILEKRAYKHRPDYEGNKKGSYIEKGKTYWDYSNGQKVGNERIVTQIQIKAQKDDKYLRRSEIKKYLKSEDAQKLFNKLKKGANKKFGEDEDDPKYRAYVYGGLVTAVSRILSANKKSGMTELL